MILLVGGRSFGKTGKDASARWRLRRSCPMISRTNPCAVYGIIFAGRPPWKGSFENDNLRFWRITDHASRITQCPSFFQQRVDRLRQVVAAQIAIANNALAIQHPVIGPTAAVPAGRNWASRPSRNEGQSTRLYASGFRVASLSQLTPISANGLPAMALRSFCRRDMSDHSPDQNTTTMTCPR